MFMVMFVSKDVEQAFEVLDVWVKAGIEGVTILESAGMSQLSNGIRDDIGIIYSLNSLMRGHEIHHRTLFSVVKERQLLDRVIQATGDFVGDWSSPEVGVLFVWPLVEAYGLEKHAMQKKRQSRWPGQS
jgi:hypothetical protein